MTSGEPSRDVELVYGRYREVVDDWDAFVDALSAPLAPILWANPERISREALARLLEADGIACTPHAWDSMSLVLTRDARPGRHWAHWGGLFYVQEESSILPVHVLDPRPGERVLDLCAAPGGKAARISFALGNRGTLIANERSVPRMGALSSTIARLGLRNVTCTTGDGASYPLSAGPFDKVLVDAPCTAEGTSAKTTRWRGAKPEYRSWLAGIQRALLRRASALTRDGGRIVYATCTFAPEENEAIVDAVLAEGSLRILPIVTPPSLCASPALTSFEGRSFRPELSRAIRLWPHRSRTTGFFVALLEKIGRGEGEGGEPVRDRSVDARENAVVRRFLDMFGMSDAAFEGLRATEEGRYLRIIAEDHVVPIGPRVVATGLPLTRNRVDNPKLGTAGALAFGRHATRRVIELARGDEQRFIARETIRAPDDAIGYVIARAEGHPLGLGFVRAREDGRWLESEFPKSWSSTATGRW